MACRLRNRTYATCAVLPSVRTGLWPASACQKASRGLFCLKRFGLAVCGFLPGGKTGANGMPAGGASLRAAGAAAHEVNAIIFPRLFTIPGDPVGVEGQNEDFRPLRPPSVRPDESAGAARKDTFWCPQRAAAFVRSIWKGSPRAEQQRRVYSCQKQLKQRQPRLRS